MYIYDSGGGGGGGGGGGDCPRRFERDSLVVSRNTISSQGMWYMCNTKIYISIYSI